MNSLEIWGIVSASLIVLWLAIKVLKLIWRNGLAYILGFGVKWRPGTWAVVTGASDGIGLEYSRQLAEKGYKVLMIARNQKKLDERAMWIKSQFPDCPEVRTLAVDFSRADIYPTVAASLAALDHVDVLVNNVGIMHPYPEYFTDYSPGYIDSLLNVNVVAVTKMCELVLPKMLKQKRGIIINLSSSVAVHPMPLMSLYSASKVYPDFLSRGLQAEFAKDGLVVQSVLPGAVKTNLSKEMMEVNSASTAVNVVEFVKQALTSVGIERRTFGHRAHGREAALGSVLVGVLGENLSLRFFHFLMASMREKYLKKQQQQ